VVNVEGSKIILELTLNEARIIRKAIVSHNPDKEDEMIAIMLHSRIARLIEEKHE